MKKVLLMMLALLAVVSMDARKLDLKDITRGMCRWLVVRCMLS